MWVWVYTEGDVCVSNHHLQMRSIHLLKFSDMNPARPNYIYSSHHEPLYINITVAPSKANSPELMTIRAAAPLVEELPAAVPVVVPLPVPVEAPWLADPDALAVGLAPNSCAEE